MSSFGFGPDVAPQVTIRPPLAAARTDVIHVASPTMSTTTSTPRLAVWRRIDLRDVLRAVVHDELRARLARAGRLRLVGRRRDRRARPQRTAISRAAQATPPPTPWISTLSPARTAARPTTIRHAVWYARGNAAACSKDKPAGIGKTLRAGTTTRSAKVPAVCSPSILYDDAGALLAGAAEFAHAAKKAGLQQDAVADRDARHALADGVHDPGPVRPGNLRQRNIRDPVAHEDVEVVQGGRAHRHAHLARPGDGIGPVAVLEHLVAAVLREENGFHFKYPRLLNFSRYSRSLSGAAAVRGTTRGP